ncbi:hypothetical protein CAEBREN_18126 [Caenorhabditis brenneri]|uniref:Serpentine Receptor, class Z n=1 Tax=Caenorhabditis brenneri TaxID=135651 RepID=G0NMY1_CAEBE|nr:hypothetical protein CAEBREN_18126 [Caenorhabditis brenneri]
MNTSGLEYQQPQSPIWSAHNFLLLTCLAITLLVFPFYAHVYKLNRYRDEHIAVFQVIDHFYMISKSSQISLIIMIVCVLGLVLFGDSNPILMVGIIAICWFHLQTTTEVNHFLLSLLAIQRFMLYFFPSTHRILNFNLKQIRIIIRSSYGLSLIYTAISISAWIYDKVSNSTDVENFKLIYTIPYFISNILLFITAFLYIPVFMSIRKLIGISSNHDNQPQKYIFWQFVMAISLKILLLPFAYLKAVESSPYFTKFSHVEDSFWIVLALNGKILDAMSTPLIIQLSYLSCNKRNVKTFISVFKTKNALKEVFCSCLKPPSRIENVPHSSSGSNANTS